LEKPQASKCWKTGGTRYWLTEEREGLHFSNTLFIVTTHGLFIRPSKKGKTGTAVPVKCMCRYKNAGNVP